MYVLSFTASDGTLSSSKEVRIVVGRKPVVGTYRGLLSQSGQPTGIVQAVIRPGGRILAAVTIGERTVRFEPVLSPEGLWSDEVGKGASKLMVTV